MPRVGTEMKSVLPTGRAGWTGALFLLAVVALVVAVVPSAAEACSVCFGSGEDDWTAGFVAGTVMMLSLPPAIVLGAGFTIYRSIKRHDAEEAAADAAAKAAEG